MCRGRAGCVLAQVQSPSLPPGPALPSGIPPYAPISQPAVQFLLQGSLPLPGCGAAQSMAPVSTTPTAASEPAGHAAATTAANNSEERSAPPRTDLAVKEDGRGLAAWPDGDMAAAPVLGPAPSVTDTTGPVGGAVCRGGECAGNTQGRAQPSSGCLARTRAPTANPRECGATSSRRYTVGPRPPFKCP
mgnify:CR=1 FL=1